MRVTQKELLTSTMKDVAAASSWRSGSILWLGNISPGEVFILGWRWWEEGSPSRAFSWAPAFLLDSATLLSPGAAAGSRGAEGSPWLPSSPC